MCLAVLMRIWILFKGKLSLLLIFILLVGCTKPMTSEKKLLFANTEMIQYQINDQIERAWKISPNLPVDVLGVECIKKTNMVKFMSAIDTITYTVSLGDTLSFYVLTKDMDSAFTQIIGLPKNVNFNPEYIKLNKGISIAEVPEVYELMNVMISLTKAASEDHNMIEKRRRYHEKVLDRFSDYKGLRIIDTLNKYIPKAYDGDSYSAYYSFTMNACGFLFDENNRITHDEIIRNMGFSSTNPIFQNLALIQEFAEESKFREFYAENRAYYDSLTYTFHKLTDIPKMKNWLQQKFQMEYGSYRFVFSPLTGGAHATQRFEDNGFSQTVMFINAPSDFRNATALQKSLRMSRVVFTEIDHNYVNLVSDRFLEKIRQSFGKRAFWVNPDFEPSYYATPYLYFNEYMTWALYSLYLLDHYDQDEIEEYLVQYERFMEKNRGFLQFGAFNRKLIAIYKRGSEWDIETTYLELLSWSQELQNEKP